MRILLFILILMSSTTLFGITYECQEYSAKDGFLTEQKATGNKSIFTISSDWKTIMWDDNIAFQYKKSDIMNGGDTLHIYNALNKIYSLTVVNKFGTHLVILYHQQNDKKVSSQYRGCKEIK